MKILYDYEIFLRQRYGGVSRYFFELINGLSNTGTFDVDIFMGINNSGYGFSDTVNIKKNLKFKFADSLHFLLDYVNKKMFNKFQSVNSYSLMHKTYYYDFGFNVKYPVVSTIHDMTHELYPDFFSKGDSTAASKKNCVNRSAGIVCVSETTKNDVLRLYNISGENVRTIYHGITIKDDPDAKRIINEPYVLYVGQRGGYKNFNLLLSSYNRDNELNRNYKLICFGGGGFDLSEKLFIKTNKLADKVLHMSGSDKLLASLYKYADVFVYTSLYEGFGFPPLEAMECGCPVLTSPGGSVKEVAGDAALYFDTESHEDLLNKLYEILNNPELRTSYTVKGKQRAAMFTWEKCVSEHIDFYKEILQ